MSKRIDRPPKVDPPFQPILSAATPGSSSKQETLASAIPRNVKRRVSGPISSSPIAPAAGPSSSMADSETPSSSMQPPAKKSRTNTPWTAAEEQRLKTMREAGNSWADIAKTFPSRTEGSVKKHWYKDMHCADFAEDESQALLNAIKDYEKDKWKEIGKKVGKPAKACEQHAKELLGNKT